MKYSGLLLVLAALFILFVQGTKINTRHVKRIVKHRQEGNCKTYNYFPAIKKENEGSLIGCCQNFCNNEVKDEFGVVTSCEDACILSAYSCMNDFDEDIDDCEMYFISTDCSEEGTIDVPKCVVDYYKQKSGKNIWLKWLLVVLTKH